MSRMIGATLLGEAICFELLGFQLCFGTEQGPHSKFSYRVDFQTERTVKAGFLSAPIGTPPIF